MIKHSESGALQIHEAQTHNYIAGPAKFWDTVVSLTSNLLIHAWLVPSNSLTGIINEVASMFTQKSGEYKTGTEVWGSFRSWPFGRI